MREFIVGVWRDESRAGTPDEWRARIRLRRYDWRGMRTYKVRAASCDEAKAIAVGWARDGATTPHVHARRCEE